MILRIEELKEACSKILGAVDSNSLSTITETLELKTENNYLLINVTNREYYARVKIPVDSNEEFHATVNANLFLKLIAQTTSESIELTLDETNLNVKGNGKYKLPLIYDGDKLLELPVIDINNVTSTFNIDSNILHSIIMYNSKELTKGGITRPVQKLYYVDEQGCITFTTGACVNNFTLTNPIKILLNDRLVKLFKLFKSSSITFTLGYDAISEEIIQTKVRFEDDSICLTAILSCDDSLISSVPVSAIRSRATGVYPYSVVINKNELLEAINRLLLFTDAKSIKLYSNFEFSNDSVTIWDPDKNSNETIVYDNHIASLTDNYTAILDLMDLKTTLDSCTESHININFGDSQAIIISRKNVYNVIPECKLD